MRCLLNLGNRFRESGAYVAASRCVNLARAVGTAARNTVDGSLYLHLAIEAGLQGRADEARILLSSAATFPSPFNAPWFRDAVEYWRLYLTLVADQSLTHAQLTKAAAQVRSWRLRRDLAGLRYEFYVQQGQFEQALVAAHDHERLSRNAGLEATPAASAFPLSKLGRLDEATAAVEESLTRLVRIPPAQRPNRDLARALWELGRQSEAVFRARAAYRQAWRDGPPNCDHWALRDARKLLQAMREPIPDLPIIDPATVKVPLEDEIRAFITRLRNLSESGYKAGKFYERSSDIGR